MKTKFKPTNLGRSRPRSNGADSSTKTEAKSSTKRIESVAVREPSNEVCSKAIIDDPGVAAPSSSSKTNLPSSPSMVAPPSITPPVTPTSDFKAATVSTLSPITKFPISSATPPDTETTPPINKVKLPSNTVTPDDTTTAPPDNTATHPNMVAMPQRTISTLPNESATSVSSQNDISTVATSLDTLPGGREGLDNALALDVSLPLEIFANPSSCGETTNDTSNAIKNAAASPPEKQTEHMEKSPLCSHEDSPKPSCDDKSGGSARSSGRVQPLKSAKKKTHKRSRDLDETQSCTDVAGEDLATDAALVTKKSPARKRQRTSTKIREAPDKAVMTMRELIYYNPSANPMSTKFEDTKKLDRQSASASSSPSPEQQSVDQERKDGEAAEDEDSEETRIVPQLRIGEDGKIVVNEESLMVKTTALKDTEIISDDVVIDDPNHHTTSSSYRCKYKVTKWTQDETRTFFTALGKVGTDFTMMTLLLPKRTRKELKNKFKKEEKSNPHLISQALKVQQTRTIRT